MYPNKKLPSGTLLVAGLAAYAYYKYNKMTEEEKRTMVNDVKQKGQKLYDEYVPENIKSNLKNIFAKKEPQEKSFGNDSNFSF